MIEVASFKHFSLIENVNIDDLSLLIQSFGELGYTPVELLDIVNKNYE